MDNYALFQEYLKIDHQIDEFYHALAQGQGLSDSALWVLWSLAELGEGCTQTDICRQLFLTKQTIPSSVRKLSTSSIRRGYRMNSARKMSSTTIMPTRMGSEKNFLRSNCALCFLAT